MTSTLSFYRNFWILVILDEKMYMFTFKGKEEVKSLGAPFRNRQYQPSISHATSVCPHPPQLTTSLWTCPTHNHDYFSQHVISFCISTAFLHFYDTATATAPA